MVSSRTGELKMSSVSIKLILKIVGAPEEIVRLPFSEPVSLSAVKSAVTCQWSLFGVSYDLFYLDDVDECICLCDFDEGISEAIMHHARPTLKIIVKPKTSLGLPQRAIPQEETSCIPIKAALAGGKETPL